MRKSFSAIAVCALICSCSSVNKHKSSISIQADSTSHEATSLVTALQVNAKAKYVSADTTVKTGNELTNTKSETSYIFQEIPADAVLNNTRADDYFPASYRTVDGRQFIAVPVLKKEESKKKEWFENSGSSKSLEAENNKTASSSAETVKDTKATTDITIKESAKKKIRFSFWWIVLIAVAAIVWYYRKPILAFIKKIIPGI